jgi:hypothetical protein
MRLSELPIFDSRFVDFFGAWIFVSSVLRSQRQMGFLAKLNFFGAFDVVFIRGIRLKAKLGVFMIHSENERRKALRKLNGLKIFENRTKGLIRSIGIDYDEPLLRARAEMESLEKAIKEFEQLHLINLPPISSQTVSAIPIYLIKARQRLGWSQRELAVRSEISPQMMCKYEKDYSQVRLFQLVKIIQVVEIALALKGNGTRSGK